MARQIDWQEVMQKSSDQIVRPLTLKYAAALALLAALAVANFLILRVEIRDSAGLATIMNDAGRQRMLLHRTAILAERFVFSFDDADRVRTRAELLSEVSLLEKTHHQLMAPETPRRDGMTDVVRSIYEDRPWLLDSEMRNYLLHLRSLTDASVDDLNYYNPHLAYIRNPETIDKIRNGLDTVVDVFEDRSDAKTHQLHLLATWALASTIALLLLDGWFVFRPMVRQVQDHVAQLDNLNETLEHRVVMRTAEAEQRSAQLAESATALRESEALYSSLVHHMPMSVLRKDRQGRLTFANDKFCELVGKPLKQILGLTDADLFSSELATKYRDDDRRVMETATVLQGVELHQTHDGREMFVELLKVPLRDADNKIIGTQTMFWDVTDRKQAEQRAMRAERLAAIGQMVAGVAHESRNALQQIQACSTLLKWELEGDHAKQALIADLQRAEERLLQTFEELRGYAAPLKLDRQRCDIRDVVADSWSATEPLREGREALISERHDGVRTECIADHYQLEKVFRNLFENAVAAGDDPVRIEVGYEALNGADGSALRITVSDNGPGLSPEQQARIFEPFYTTKTQGTGLGMAIVKRIVDAHDGTIWAESNGGHGATMVVTIPCGTSPRRP